jgi:nucleotide-binding universal stress UspA family protein
MPEAASHRWSKPASILLATDLADVDKLLPFAIRQAKESGAHIFVLHVLTGTNSIAVDQGGLPYYNPTEAFDYAEKYLATYCADARRANVDCEVIIREGGSAQQILATARQMRVDQILLGTRSRGKWGKLLLGSVAEQVLRSAPVPVFTVGPEANLSEAAVDGHVTVLHATSLSRASGASAALACEVARASSARLVLLHVLPPSADGNVAPGLMKRAEEEMLAMIPQDLACQCAATVRVACGNVAIEILAQAAATNASLIVLGAAYSSPIGAMTREGTVYRVLSHAHCPVLTLKERDAVPGESMAMTSTALRQ